MTPLYVLLVVAASLFLSGCTQPDGKPDPYQGDDPDNPIHYDDDDGVYDETSVLVAVVLIALAVRQWQWAAWARAPGSNEKQMAQYSG